MPPSQLLNLSSLKNAKDNKPRPLALTWARLAERLTEHAERASKDGPAWSPAVYPDGATRGNQSVEAVSLLVLDFDGGDAPDRFVETWTKQGLAFVVHSSYSSKPDAPKWRAVFPLAAPVPASEWPGAYRRMASALGDGATDPACKDAARLYFLPAHPAGAEPFAVKQIEGAWLQPSSFPEPDPQDVADAYAANIRRARELIGGGTGNGKPGHDFNERATIDDVLPILLRAGWQEHSRRGVAVYLTRPGKPPREGMSAVLGFRDNPSPILTVFTSSAPPFESGKPYAPFGVLGMLEHGGDFAAAARDLGAKGFGEKSIFSNSCRSLKGGRGTGNKREGEGIETPYYKRDIEKIEKIDKTAPWEADPAPLGAESLPLFPVDALPPVLHRFAVGVSASVGTAPDLPGVLLLAAVAAAAQKRVAVRAKVDHTEQLTLWAVSIAPPGARKSPIMGRIRQPFAAHEATENAARLPQIEQYESEERVARRRLDKAEADMARASSSEARSNAAADLDTARRDLKDLTPVRPLRLLVDDATPEAVAQLLSENAGRLAVLDAEGAIFGQMSGRYTDKPSIETFLKSWTGESFTSDRAGKERRSVSVRGPALTLGVAVQPSVIAALRGKKELVGVGALARCLFSFADDSEAADSYDTPPVPAGVEEKYRALIAELLTLTPSMDRDDDGEPLPHFVGMEEDARAAFSAFYSEVRAEIHAEGEGLFAEWLAKAHGQALRIAGVLHLAKHGKIGAEKPIDRETMGGAFELTRYFMAHARAALARIREGEEVEDARRVLAWVKRNRKAAQNPDGLPLGELRRQIRSIATQEEMEAALHVLTLYGYAREVEPEERPEGKAGRKPGSRWQFHPAITWEMEA